MRKCKELGIETLFSTVD